MQRLNWMLGSLFLALTLGSCGLAAVETKTAPTSSSETSPIQTEQSQSTQNDISNDVASVTAVSVNGESERYQFSVTIRSRDEGCNAYANWWEVITPQGELLYRRVLFHSHVEEQPFTRSGGPVALKLDQEAVVRVHFDPSGYSTQAQKGTVSGGFEAVILPSDFASMLAEQEPLPQGCNF